MTETREQFEARYPRPGTHRPHESKPVLIHCVCEAYEDRGLPHWGWGTWYFDRKDGGLFQDETLAEPAPERG